jgi:hypothetical protein
MGKVELEPEPEPPIKLTPSDWVETPRGSPGIVAPLRMGIPIPRRDLPPIQKAMFRELTENLVEPELQNEDLYEDQWVDKSIPF